MKDPKYEYGSGPWDGEPDRLEFEAHGLPCLMRRTHLGAWCGYVAVPPGHPFHGMSPDNAVSDLDVHGGITYGDGCRGDICHVAKPGTSDDVWWFGFDCAHAGDLIPWMLAQEEFDEARARLRGVMGSLFRHDVYRTMGYVRAQCEQLAAQLVAAAKGSPTEQSDD